MIKLPISQKVDELEVVRSIERLYGMIYAFDYTRDPTDEYFLDCQEQCMASLSEIADGFMNDTDQQEFYILSSKATQLEVAAWLVERTILRLMEGMPDDDS